MMKKLLLAVMLTALWLGGCTPVPGAMSASDALTSAKEEAIKPGMTYAQCEKIIGRPGQIATDSGRPGSEGNLQTGKASTGKFAAYAWKNSDGSSLELVFHNDRLVTKEFTNFNVPQE